MHLDAGLVLDVHRDDLEPPAGRSLEREELGGRGRRADGRDHGRVELVGEDRVDEGQPEALVGTL